VGLQVAIDLWVQGVADHVAPITVTSFTHFAVRGGGSAGRKQLLEWGSSYPGYKHGAGNKFLPVCDAIPPPLPTGHDRMPRGGCLALRWAVLSSVAARALVPGSETATAVAQLVTRYRQRAARPPPAAVRAANTGCVLLEGDDLVRSYEPTPTGLAGCLAKRDTPPQAQRRQGRSHEPMCVDACAEEPPAPARKGSPSRLGGAAAARRGKGGTQHK